jgi:hypothetical protein
MHRSKAILKLTDVRSQKGEAKRHVDHLVVPRRSWGCASSERRRPGARLPEKRFGVFECKTGGCLVQLRSEKIHQITDYFERKVGRRFKRGVNEICANAREKLLGSSF